MKANSQLTKACNYFIMAGLSLIIFAIIFMSFVHNPDINLKLKIIASGVLLAAYYAVQGFTIANKDKKYQTEEVK